MSAGARVLRIRPGDTFGRLTVIKYLHSTQRGRVYRCECVCETVVDVAATHLKCGEIVSCGCRKISHGMCGTPTYESWIAMLTRCTNSRASNYHNYGGRGVTVCDRWRKFAAFYEDMGDRPEGMTLDRIDPDDNYEPSNCRWATVAEQNRNKRPKYDRMADEWEDSET